MCPMRYIGDSPIKYIGEGLGVETWKMPVGKIYLIVDRCKGYN